MTKVILIMSFSTSAAEYDHQPRPRFCWTNPQGELVGIWDLEWGDIMLKRLVNHYPDYDCEIWQPETRADKTYSARLHDRLVHSKFPAVLRKVTKRFKTNREIFSPAILAKVREYDNADSVFLLPAAVYSKWLKEIASGIKVAGITYYNLLNVSTLLPSPIKTANPIKALNRMLINIEKQSWLQRMRGLLTPNTNPQTIKKLRELHPRLSVYELKWGLDDVFWQAVMSKSEARAQLGLEAQPYLIVLSQRLVPEYQVDRLIEALPGPDSGLDYICLITGHGEEPYVAYLRSLAERKGLREKVRFLGFVSDEDLRTCFTAADLFVSVPLRSAGSGGALKAMAMGTPVFLTTSCGESSHFLRDHQAGILMAPTDYDGWTKQLSHLINGLPVKTINRDVILRKYNSRYTADSINQALQHWN